MRYLGNDTNIVRDAVLTGTNGIASDAIYRTDTAAKHGGGDVVLSGPYTGAADTTIDVEIVDNAGGTIQVSNPAFSGVGNGTMTGVAVVDIDPQVVTIQLRNLGTDTIAAYTSFQGTGLKAQTAGSGGNAIAIDVDHSALVSSATDWSLQEDMRQGVNEYIGDHWNFGALALEPSGDIPVTAPRLRFANDPQVYRQWKKYVSGRYVYSFEPAPVRDVPHGARVHAITGTRSVTVTDGITPETYTGIVTLYEALSAMEGSSLITLDGGISLDRKPGGMGITELSVFTRSYIIGVTNTGNGSIAHSELQIAALDTAPTETLTFTCADVSSPGSERWDVRGEVSGALARATTNLTYADGRYTALIPLAEIDPTATTGTILIEYVPANRAEADRIPSLCVESPRIGGAARNGVWEYILTPRPPEDCDCSSGDFEGGPNDDCLGTTTDPGGDVSEASQLIRIQRLVREVRARVESNTTPTDGVDVADVGWVEKGANILLKCIQSLTAEKVNLPAWVLTHAYAQDFVIQSGGNRFAATTPGTSGGTLPTFNTSVDATTTDGGVTWTCLGKVAYGMWDDLFTSWKADAATLDDVDASPRVTWTPQRLWLNGALCVPSVPNGHYYSAATTGSPNVSGAVSGANQETPWSITGGTSIETSMEDGTAGAAMITWTDEGLDPFTTSTSDVYFERYRTAVADILAAAGIVGNFENAGLDGDGCWRDWKDPKWWVFNGSEPYLPIFTGHYYHSSKTGTNLETGKPYAYSTHEFGFGPRFGCPDLLINGDMMRITITGVAGGSSGYQIGDAFNVRVNQANPLPFGGGQTGDDTLTWSVKLSDDGAQDDYALVTTALTPYSTTVGSGTLGFAITPGGIAFALGDQFQFTIEGGRFKWRRDGGAWSDDLDIADTALDDGLTAKFTGGIAPSWVAADRWSFKAEATFGVSQLSKPVDGEFTWEGSTVIEIVPSETEIVGIAITNHSIPSDAVIVLQGSDDNFSTTPLSVIIPWRAGDIWHAVAADREKYRVTVDKSGSARWIYLGKSTQPHLPTGVVELGKFEKDRRLPGTAQRVGLAGKVEHTGLVQSGVDQLTDMLDHACQYDDSLLALVPNDARPELGMVRYTGGKVTVTDVQDFQPTDIDSSLQAVTLQFEAAA